MSNRDNPDSTAAMLVDVMALEEIIARAGLEAGDEGFIGIGVLSNEVLVSLALNDTAAGDHGEHCRGARGCDGCPYLEDEEDVVERAQFDFENFFKKTKPLARVDKTDWKTYVYGKAVMFKGTPDNEYVHGYDTFIPIASAATRVLQDGERIDQLSEIRWMKPLTENVRFAIYEVGRNMPSDIEEEDISYRGRFRTSHGREFNFVAVQTGDKINRFMDPIATFSEFGVSDKYLDGDIYVKTFIPALYEELVSMGKHDTAYVSRSLMEIMTKTLLEVFGDIKIRRFPEGGMSRGLFCGIEGLDLPENIGEVFTEGARLEVRVLEDEMKVGKTGFEIWPVEYRFHFQEDWNRAMIAFRDEQISL